mgnify:CR=1 FL=1
MDLQKEKALLIQLKNAETDAFRIIFRSFFQPLYLFARKFVDHETARDVVQESFLELWRNRKKLNITTSFSSWLFTIVKNRCYKHLKEEKRKNGNQENYRLKLKEEEFRFFADSEESILEFDVKERIEGVIQRLPGKCRQVFEESRFRGLSNKEISEKYDISLKAVEKHISKALKIFREEFSDWLPFLVPMILFNVL